MNDINSAEQLRRINRQLGFLSTVGRIPHYHFVIPDLPESSNREANELMSNYQNACGCFSGGLLMGTCVILFIGRYLVSDAGFTAFGLKDSVAFVALFVGSTLAGKMLGLLWARIRMRQLIKRMVALANRQVVQQFA